MAKLWPLPSSTVVSARRTVRAGIWMVELLAVIDTAPCCVSSLTSGRTCRLIAPSDSTVGTKASEMPYCLKSIVTLLSAVATGSGNSPPTRKLAGSPLTVVRLGSARTCTSWSCDNASMMVSSVAVVPPTLKRLRRAMVFCVADRAEIGVSADTPSRAWLPS